MLTPTLKPTIQILNKEEEILKRIILLKSRISETNRPATQFDIGWNLAAQSEIEFLQTLLT